MVFKKNHLLISAIIMSFNSYGSAHESFQGQPTPPYYNQSLEVELRVKDLMSRMTLSEKIGQMTQVERNALKSNDDLRRYHIGSILSGGGSAPSTNTAKGWADMIDNYQSVALQSRLKIPIIYGVDAVHGHNNVIGATIFPHNIGLGATGNSQLAKLIGEVTARELSATGVDWNFSPCLCVARDERWGRTYESFSEDPKIVSQMTSMITGLQGEDLKDRSTVLATAKHWLGDGGALWGTSLSFKIDRGDARLSEAELRKTHALPYLSAIQRGVGSMMASYSSWNGVKMHENKYLNTEVLKNELGFEGFLVSDWKGIDELPGNYNDDVRNSINSGIDMVMVPHDYENFIRVMNEEIANGGISMERVDDAVRRILTKKFELGLFEDPFARRELLSTVGSAEHRNVARQAVRESQVLLKNNGILPIQPDHEVVVVGPKAKSIGHQSGGWTISWQGSPGNITQGTTIFQGIQSIGRQNVSFSESAIEDLSKFGMAVVVVGEDPYAEGIGDKEDLHLSLEDQQLIERSCSKIDCVVILLSGRPMIVDDILPKVSAMVASWLPGSEGGGIAEVLYGHYNFTGKLTMSWPRTMDQIPINIGDKQYAPLFPLGYGLTY